MMNAVEAERIQARAAKLRDAYGQIQTHADAYNLVLQTMQSHIARAVVEYNRLVLQVGETVTKLMEIPVVDQEFVVDDECQAALDVEERIEQ